MLEHLGPMTLSGGLAYAIQFAETLDSALDGLDLNITVSGIRDGLFFYDHIRDRGVLVTMNVITSSGRMYLGRSRDFDFESKSPRESLRAHDWHKSELENVVQAAVAFMVDIGIEQRFAEA